MSNTRYASPDSPLAHEKYLSDVRFVERRGINGRAVAEKAAILKDATLRRLILFLQGVSVADQGLGQVQEWIATQGGEHLGTPTMRRLGLQPSLVCCREDVIAIRKELGLQKGVFPLKHELEPFEDLEPIQGRGLATHHRELDQLAQAKAAAGKHPECYLMGDFIMCCQRKVSEELGKFLIELCINPAVSVPTSAVDAKCADAERLGRRACSAFPWLDVGAALADYEKHRTQSVQAGVVETTISKKVCTGIERAREIHHSLSPVPSHIVILQGIEGVGKTTAAKAKCRLHLAEMRFVPLLGNVTYKSFFRSLSLACGLPSGDGLKAEQMKNSVENFLRLTRMILVIDEAHRCFPQGPRVYVAPEVMNWIYTLSEYPAPVVLLVTPQFATRMDVVESCTDWRSGQLKRRVRHYVTLPEKASDKDLEAVTLSRFPKAAAGLVDEVVGFASSSRYPFDAIHNIATDAYRLATDAGRTHPRFEDVVEAIETCAGPTYRALTTKRDVHSLNQSKGRRTPREKSLSSSQEADALPDGGSVAAAPRPRSRRGGIEEFHQDEEPTNRVGKLAPV